MNDNAGDLSDALRDLAATPVEDGAVNSDGADEEAADLSHEMAAEIDDEAGDAIAAFPAASGPAPRSTQMPRSAGSSRGKNRKKNDSLKAVMIPVCGVLGLLMLAIGMWAVATLLGDSPRALDARPMAWVMMVCWPIAVALIIGAVIMWIHLRRSR